MTDPQADLENGTLTLPLEFDRRHAMSELVLEIATAAAGTRSRWILQAALDRLGRAIAFTGGSIALVDGDDLGDRVAAGPFVGEALGQRLPRGRGRSWQVLDTLETGFIDDFQASAVQPAGAAAKLAMRSWLAVPISRRGGDRPVRGRLDRAFRLHRRRRPAARDRRPGARGADRSLARYAAEQRSRVLRDAFTGMVSHELRTPVTTIFGMSQLLPNGTPTWTPSAAGQLIEDIEADPTVFGASSRTF